MFTFGISTQSNSGLEYALPGYAPATASEVAMRVSEQVEVSSLAVQQNALGTGTGTITYTVRKNGVDTTLILVLLPTDSGGTVFDTNFSFSPGDLLSVSVNKSGTITAAPQDVIISLGNG